MTSLEQYSIYMELCLELLTACFLVVGSIIVFKSKRTKTTWSLLSSSTIYAISQLIASYLTFKTFGFDYNNLLAGPFADPFYDPFDDPQFTKLLTYLNYAFYASTLSITVFTFAFVVFCFNIANLYKRYEELEFLNSEMAKRDK